MLPLNGNEEQNELKESAPAAYRSRKLLIEGSGNKDITSVITELDDEENKGDSTPLTDIKNRKFDKPSEHPHLI